MSYTINTVNKSSFDPGQYIGVVTDNSDSMYTGRVSVRFGEFGSLKGSEIDHVCLLCTPYGGVTDTEDYVKDKTAYGEDGTSTNGTIKSYGMWVQPPAVGTTVLVVFTGILDQGIIIGSLIDGNRNHMMGGRASAESHNDDVTPVGEKNPFDVEEDDKKPVDPIATKWLKEQGLDKDYVRGHSMSSARRETPSNVFGFTTLNGHVFTMDDGDIKGNSKNIRLRTRQGAQVLLDDTNKMVFVNNHNGSAWVEIDEHGKVDVYSATSVSIHAEEDINFHANRDINMEAGKGVNIKANDIKVEASNNYNLHAGTNVIVEALNNIENKCSTHIETASMVYMNSSPTARAATKPTVNSLSENSKVSASVAARVPEHHPWDGASKIQESIKTAKGKT